MNLIVEVKVLLKIPNKPVSSYDLSVSIIY